jgi:hypothetical protein
MSVVLVACLCSGVFGGEGGGVFGEVNKAEVSELTSGIPSEGELAEFEELIRKFKLEGGDKLKTEISNIEANLMHKVASGDAGGWTVEDFDKRVKVAVRLDTLRQKWRGGGPGGCDRSVWGKWSDWASSAGDHKDFFSRLMFGFKNRNAVVSNSSDKAYSQAVYAYMNGHKDLFPDLKSKLVFCSQLAAAGVKDSGIAVLPKTLIEEDKAK